MLEKLKKHLYPIAKIAFNVYQSKQRKYTYNGIEVIVHPEVFPPKYTISTKLLLHFIAPLNLKGKTLLELGCGSGIISLFAASKEAKVTASDINEVALDALKIASTKNDISVNIVYSDLFENLSEYHFDYIIINPPYYPKTPKNDKESAWFCGENFEYFEDLFSQLPPYIAQNTWMILSEDCDIERIKNIAAKNRLSLEMILEKTVAKEKNFIFRIQNK